MTYIPFPQSNDIFSPLFISVFIVHSMYKAGNNVWVTFSSTDEIASQKAKLFGSSAKMDTFNRLDMSRFPQWVAQFLSGVNLYQPSEPQACRVAFHLLRDKAAEMTKKSLNTAPCET